MAFVEFATGESTPLSPSNNDAAPSSVQHHHRRCIPLFILTITATVVVTIVLLSSRLHILMHSNHVNDHVSSSTVRQDVDAGTAPPQISLMQPSQEFYLPALNPSKKLLLGRTSDNQKQQRGLRWGILGLGRIAHDFTSA